MFVITTPDNNLKERKYIIDIIFNEFLDVKYYHEMGSQDYEIILPNDNKLIFKDHFFKKYSHDLEYLNKENIPEEIQYIKNDFIINQDIPIIFGTSELRIYESESIICGIDIFASIFFMLSRWEEYVNPNRDNHNRFPATESISYNNGFLKRAVVNEYIEMLWNMLLHLGFKKQRTIPNNQIFITHDIDRLYMWNSWKHVIRVAMGDLLKRKNISSAKKRLSGYFLLKRKKINDPYDTFDWLMDISENNGSKSRFYLMSGGVTNYDNCYNINDSRYLTMIKNINQRGHIIGLHSSYNTYNDSTQFNNEKSLLESTTGMDIIEGRGHYLRFEVPTTWQIWEDCGMEVDSTCGYSDKEGFRCGTGHEYSVFNILTRQKLKLKERPLLIMDRTIYYNQNLDDTERKEIISSIIDNTNMFTILWHNSEMGHVDLYKYILKYFTSIR